MTGRRRRAAVVAPALVAMTTAGCGPSDGPSSAAPESTTGGAESEPAVEGPPSSTGAVQEEPVRILLTIGNQEASATLEDNAASRDLVAMLPLTIAMGDLFGQEKPGPLPRPLTGEVQPVFTYRVGQLAYWPPSHDIVVVYAVGDARVPSPGLIPLGTVDDGIEVIAAAGDDFPMTITALD